ncbi:MAG: hypothetical protein ACT4OT_10175 [Acidobacteriota bacterium]
MALSENEVNALRLLPQEELPAQIRPFRDEIGKRFDELATHMDAL